MRKKDFQVYFGNILSPNKLKMSFLKYLLCFANYKKMKNQNKKRKKKYIFTIFLSLKIISGLKDKKKHSLLIPVHFKYLSSFVFLIYSLPIHFYFINGVL